MKGLAIAAAMAAVALAGVALAQGSGLSAAQRGASFDQADANYDGLLDPDEFLNAPRGHFPNNPIRNWLASDKNKDGFVTRQEFVEPMIGEDP